jgi:hypothetical protein
LDLELDDWCPSVTILGDNCNIIDYTVGLESIAMFGTFGLFAVWCYTVKKSHLALQRESKVLLLGFLMDFILYNLNQ